MHTFGMTYEGQLVSLQYFNTPEEAWKECVRRSTKVGITGGAYGVVEITPLVRKEVTSITWEKK